MLEGVDARLVAEAIEWAGTHEAAVNEHFNVTNGEFFMDKAATWERIVERHGLRPFALTDILGESHHYAYGATEPPPPAFSSRIKLQQAGFTACQDTQATFDFWLRDLIARRVLPGPLSEAAMTPPARRSS